MECVMDKTDEWYRYCKPPRLRKVAWFHWDTWGIGFHVTARFDSPPNTGDYAPLGGPYFKVFAMVGPFGAYVGYW
jgi:hypothetical protein